jgi:hypothetical protein
VLVVKVKRPRQSPPHHHQQQQQQNSQTDIVFAQRGKRKEVHKLLQDFLQACANHYINARKRITQEQVWKNKLPGVVG